MPEHIRYARNRREFLTDCFCGVGSLAFASMMAQEQAHAAKYNPLAPKPPHMPGQGEVRDLRVHGGRTVAPGDVRPEAAAEQAARPEASGRIRRGEVSVRQRQVTAARHKAHVHEVRQVGHRGVRPVPASGEDCRRPVHHPVDVRRHGGALGGAVSDDDRPRDSRLSRDGELD